MSLILAILLDALLGEPRWLWSRLPHPAVVIGNIISKLSKLMNHAPQQKRKGVLLVLILAIGGGITGILIT